MGLTTYGRGRDAAWAIQRDKCPPAIVQHHIRPLKRMGTPLALRTDGRLVGPNPNCRVSDRALGKDCRAVASEHTSLVISRFDFTIAVVVLHAYARRTLGGGGPKCDILWRASEPFRTACTNTPNAANSANS